MGRFQSNKPLIRMILLVLEKNQDSFETLREKLTAPLAEFFTHGKKKSFFLSILTNINKYFTQFYQFIRKK